MTKQKVYKKGYKGFNAGLKCRDKQYAENTVFEEYGGNICGSGVMHFCEVPLCVFNYYPIFHIYKGEVIYSEFARVEALSDCQQDGDKTATAKLKIGAKINLAELCKAQIEYVKEKTGKDATHGLCEHSATTEWRKLSGTFGEYANSTTTGDSAYSVTAGDHSHSVTTGLTAHSATIGYKAHSVTTGGHSYSVTTGNRAHSVTTGWGARSATTGLYAHSTTMGFGACSYTSGCWSCSVTNGGAAHSVTTGDHAHSVTTGSAAYSVTTGVGSHAVATGGDAHSSATGKNSIATALGAHGWAKASKGNWIVLAEYNSNGDILHVKTAKVDGRRIKENTFYKLEHGKFVEVKL